MQQFIKKCLFFGVLLLIIAVIVDMVISYRLLHSKERVLKAWNDMYTTENYHNLLILGSSRALVQYDPRIIDSALNINCYNFGMNGGSINYQIAKYNAYCRHKRKPQFVVQNIDFLTISITREHAREQFFPYFIYDRALIKELAKDEDFSFCSQYIPCIRYVGYPKLVQYGLGLKKSIWNEYYTLDKGYSAENKRWDGSKFEQISTIPYGNDPLALQLFDKYLSQLQKDGIKTIFVYAPIYSGLTAKIDDREGMYKMYDSFAVKYNIPILDYNYWSLCDDTTYFYNAMHLNKRGAEKFSRQLAHDLDSLGIISPRAQ